MIDLPEPWASAFVAAGVVDPRGRGDRPSLRQLALRTGIATTTLSEMVRGGRRTQQENVDKVADALQLDPRTVAAWLDVTRSERDPYQPPAEANLLDQDERKAIDRLITLMARGKRGSDAKKMSSPGPKGARGTPGKPGRRHTTWQGSTSGSGGLGSPDPAPSVAEEADQSRKG